MILHISNSYAGVWHMQTIKTRKPVTKGMTFARF